jgi:hypothetical protein
MTIDDFIADKVRKRFNLPAEMSIFFYINPVPADDYEIQIYLGLDRTVYYDSWEDFVADMERNDD